MEKLFEKGFEKIPTKEGVMEIISRHAEHTTPVRELHDKEGLYLLEVKADGGKAGEMVLYQYMRKGSFPNHHKASETSIHAVYLQDDVPFSGESIANYGSETGTWEEVV